MDSSEKVCASLPCLSSQPLIANANSNAIALHYKYTTIFQDLEIRSKKHHSTSSLFSLLLQTSLALSPCQASVATATAPTAETARKYFFFLQILPEISLRVCLSQESRYGSMVIVWKISLLYQDLAMSTIELTLQVRQYCPCLTATILDFPTMRDVFAI